MIGCAHNDHFLISDQPVMIANESIAIRGKHSSIKIKVSLILIHCIVVPNPFLSRPISTGRSSTIILRICFDFHLCVAFIANTLFKTSIIWEILRIIGQRIKGTKGTKPLDESRNHFFIQRIFLMRWSEIFYCACIVMNFYEDRPQNSPVEISLQPEFVQVVQTLLIVPKIALRRNVTFPSVK